MAPLSTPLPSSVAGSDRERFAKDRVDAADERATLESELHGAYVDELTGASHRTLGTVALGGGEFVGALGGADLADVARRFEVIDRALKLGAGVDPLPIAAPAAAGIRGGDTGCWR